MRLRYLKDIHYEASALYTKYHHVTGVPLVILAALANAGVWAVVVDMSLMKETYVQLVLALIATIITILSAFQAFLGFDKKSEMHKNAATQYSSLNGDVDLLLKKSGGHRSEELHLIKEKWGIITNNSPLLPEKLEKNKKTTREG